jgi:hypothetical protein
VVAKEDSEETLVTAQGISGASSKAARRMSGSAAGVWNVFFVRNAANCQPNCCSVNSAGGVEANELYALWLLN